MGATGAQGPPGGGVGTITVQREDFTVAASPSTGLQVACPAGTQVIGGGAALADPNLADIPLTASRPFRTTPGADGDRPVDGGTFDAWRVTFANPAGGTASAAARAWAIWVQT